MCLVIQQNKSNYIFHLNERLVDGCPGDVHPRSSFERKF